MNKTVLIVEDFDDTRELLRIMFRALGLHVVEAVNGVEAIARVEETLPDLILLDAAIPKMDGIETTVKIRDRADSAHIPIICLTAHRDRYYELALEAGCSEVIAKPVELNDLAVIVSRYLN
jgi:CheY-like chemotaxis protein